MGNYSVEEVIGDVGRYDVGDGGGDDELGEKTPNVGLHLLSSLDYKLFVSTQVKNSITMGIFAALKSVKATNPFSKN
ncbi:hypothetical protein FF1_004626 [Malus domestica]